MRKKLLLAIVFFAISGLSFFVGFRFLETRGQLSALQVTTTPKSQVYLNGNLLGATPLFNDKLKPGEYTLKIISEGNPIVFEQKIKLSPLLLTATDRTFRETEARSEGSILTLEQILDKERAEIVIMSSPTEAKVFLDKQIKGVTPLNIKDATVSDHEIEVSSAGFIDKKVRIKTSAGYKLIANIKLAVSLEEEQQATPSPTLAPTPIPAAPTVKIKQTPTGFLRVRISPSLSASEVAKVRPGENFPILEETNEWTKIKLPDGTSGWVSNLYIIKQ